LEEAEELRVINVLARRRRKCPFVRTERPASARTRAPERAAAGLFTLRRGKSRKKKGKAQGRKSIQ